MTQDPKGIRNKIKRSMVFHANKAKAAAAKKEAKEQQKQLEEKLGAAAPPKAAARTLDNTREWDDTYVDKEDPELLADEADDEFADIFNCDRTPKIMITTKVRPSGPIFLILKELIALFPNAFYYKRGASPVENRCASWAHLGIVSLYLTSPLLLPARLCAYRLV
jgi:ribosome production factor 1